MIVKSINIFCCICLVIVIVVSAAHAGGDVAQTQWDTENVNGKTLKSVDVTIRDAVGGETSVFDDLMLTNFTFTANNEESPPLQWFEQWLNHHSWTQKHLQTLSVLCLRNLQIYLQHLHNGTSWALKMNDASGRYNGQFFFGNDFWVGSKSSCEELQNPSSNAVVPPFATHFFMAKILLVKTILNDQRRQLTIGLCLPDQCSTQDVHSIVQRNVDLASSFSNETTLELVNVRRVPGNYNIYHDIKFQILAICTILTFIIIIFATTYEWLLVRAKSLTAGNSSQESNNNNSCDTKNHEHVSVVTIEAELYNRNKGPDSAKKKITAFFSEFIQCFSALSNGKKILSMEKPADAITCVHGLRFLSLAWVIMVHTYLQVFASASNKTMRKITERHFIYQTVSNATFSVDTFFFISGLLLSLLYFRADKKQNDERRTRNEISNSKGLTMSMHQPSPLVEDGVVRRSSLKFLTLILHRLIRLTPAYLFVLELNEVAIRWIVDTSVFDIVGVNDHINCHKYWWRNILYLNNLYPLPQMCMIWSWYMANDTQFYIIGVILMLIAVRHLKVATGILIGFLITSWITTFTIASLYNYHARIEEPFAQFDALYDKPWTRIGPYLIGMITGWLLFKVNCQLQMSRLVASIGWILSILCLCSLVYGLGADGLKTPASAFYISLGHTAWGVSIAWITVACCTGYGGPINSLLSFRGMLPLSRLTYCAYLVHPIIMVITGYQKDGPVHLHNGIVFIITCGNIVVSFLLSLCISLAFEAPAVRILQLCTGRKGKHE